MPIYVDPSVANPPPPEVIVSPDGILTATVRPGGEGVFLEADFRLEGTPGVPGVPEQVLRTNRSVNPRNTLTPAWRATTTSAHTVEQITLPSSPPGTNLTTGAKSTVVSSTSAVTSIFDCDGFGTSGSTPARRMGIWVYVSLADCEARIGNAAAGNAYVDTPVNTWTWVSATNAAGGTPGGMVQVNKKSGTGTAPVGTEVYATGSNIVLQGTSPTSFFDGQTAPNGNKRYRTVGDRHEEYLPAVDPIPPGDPEGEPPVRVRLERNGQPISSGDPAQAPGGFAIGYDLFAPHEEPLTYRAIPTYYNGTEGTPSEALSVVLPEPPKWGSRRRVVWLKSARRPDLSMRVQAVGETPSFDREGRTNLQSVPGTHLPAGSSDVQSSWAFSLEFLTETEAEQIQMEALLTAGTLLLQTPSAWRLRDLWVEPGTVGMTPHSRMDTGAHRWTVELTEVPQPSTADSPLVVPGRSWQWANDTYTWQGLDAVFDSWRSVVTPA